MSSPRDARGSVLYVDDEVTDLWQVGHGTIDVARVVSFLPNGRVLLSSGTCPKATEVELR